MSEGTSTTESTTGRAGEKDHPRKPLITITVNTKPVKIEGPRVTGLQIKQAAIEQGVDIELEYELAEIRPNGEERIIGDDDVVTVNKNSEFVATAGDDNS
jgi:multiubiquitin